MDCSSIHLCMKDTTLLRNIHFYVIFDTCNSEIIIGIEELKYTIPFKKMNWGMSYFLYLNNYVLNPLLHMLFLDHDIIFYF